MSVVNIHLIPKKFRKEILSENGEWILQKEEQTDKEVCNPETFLVFKFSGREPEEIYSGTKEGAKRVIKSVTLENVDPLFPASGKAEIINRKAKDLEVIGLCETDTERITIFYEIKAQPAPAPKPKPTVDRSREGGFSPGI